MSDHCDGCPIAEGHCPGAGANNPRLCGFVKDDPSYRAEAEAVARHSLTRPGVPIADLFGDDEARAMVEACPDRGSILPFEPGLDCDTCGDVYLCRAGKGEVPGRVRYQECVRCRWDARLTRAARGLDPGR